MNTRNALDHYDEEYFNRQNFGDHLRGQANHFKFADYVNGADEILDFGCGGGALLQVLGGGTGVEVNPHAASVAASKGLRVKRSLRELEDRSFDLVISNHALEHVEDPLECLREMRRVLRDGGRLVIVVPCDAPWLRYRRDDPDLHLFPGALVISGTW